MEFLEGKNLYTSIFKATTIPINTIPTTIEETAIISAKSNFIKYNINNDVKNKGKAINGFKSTSNTRSIHITKKLTSLTNNITNIPKNIKLLKNIPKAVVFINIAAINDTDNKKLIIESL